MCRLIFGLCLLVTFGSAIEDANDWIFKLNNAVTIGYCAEHDYFVYYNPNINVAFLYNRDIDVKIFADTKYTQTLMIVTREYGYLFVRNYTFDFGTTEAFKTSFNYLWEQTVPLYKMVHQGQCETCNAIPKNKLKTYLLNNNEIELSASPALRHKPLLAVQLNLGYYKLIEQSHLDLVNNKTFVHGAYTFTYAGLQPSDKQSEGVTLFYVALTLHRISHTKKLSTVFYDNLINKDDSANILLGKALLPTYNLYKDVPDIMEKFNTSFTYNRTKMIINGLSQIFVFKRDNDTKDWAFFLITEYHETIISYFADINVLIMGKIEGDCMIVYDGTCNNYAVYNLINGAGIIVNKKSGKATITYKHAKYISEWQLQCNLRNAIEHATKALRETDVDKAEKTFDFYEFVKSAYNHGELYVVPKDKELRLDLDDFFMSLIVSLYHIKDFDDNNGAANIVLYPLNTHLNKLPSRLAKLMKKIGTNDGSRFNSDNMTTLYNDLVHSCYYERFNDEMFQNLGV